MKKSAAKEEKNQRRERVQIPGPAAGEHLERALAVEGGQAERLAPDRRFQGLQVEAVQTLAAQQRFDIPEDLSGEEAVEGVFFYCPRPPIPPGVVASRRSVRTQQPTAEPVDGNDGTGRAAGAFAAQRGRLE